MDTSEKYIKMCQEAWPLIKREVRIGDLMMVVGDSDPARCVGIHEVPADQFGEVAKYQYLSPFQKCLSQGKNMLTTNNRVYYGYVGHTFIVWTQDQLQEMVWKAGILLMLNEIKDFCGEYFYIAGSDKKPLQVEFTAKFDWHPTNSMEQLWLVFVMREKYHRAWDDKKETWVKLPFVP